MRIISLNTWGGKCGEKLEEFFGKYAGSTDVFCLQEIFNFERIRSLLPDHVGYFHPSQNNEEGLATFVRKGIEVKEAGDVFVYRWKDAMTDGDAKTLGRNLQYVSLSLDSESFLVANFHGLWNGAGKSDTADRIKQSENIRDFLRGRNENNKIIVGDFNLAPNTESIGILEKDMRNLIREHNITSTRTSLYKYKSVEPYADYAFVSTGAGVESFEVLEDEVSDHAPLSLMVRP